VVILYSTDLCPNDFSQPFFVDFYIDRSSSRVNVFVSLTRLLRSVPPELAVQPDRLIATFYCFIYRYNKVARTKFYLDLVAYLF